MVNGPKSMRRAATAACTLAAIGAALAGPVRAQSADATALGEGRAYTASHGASESFTYTFEARAAGTYLIEVEQQGLDLVLTLEAPGGGERSFDSPLLRDERELALVADAVAGRYAVTLRSDEHTGATGGHTIRLTELTTADAGVVAAWRSMTRGAAANLTGGEAAWREAVAAYESAAARWQALGATRERAQALFAAATVEYWQRYDWARAAELADAAAGLYAMLDSAALSANALHLEAAALVESALETTDSAVAAGARSAQAQFDEALALLDEARRTHERLGRVYDLALVVNNIGYTHFSRGRLDEARSHWEQAATLMRSIDEWSGELNPRANLAVVDAEAGRVATAIESFERVLEILPEGRDPRYRADTLDNLGISHLLFGNADEALSAFDAALSIQQRIDDLQGRGRSLRGIGRVYHSIGQLDLAQTYLNEALPIAQRTNDGRTQEGILRDLGNIAYLEQDYDRALELHRDALDIVQSAHDETYLRVLIAKDLIALGRHDEAEELAARARDAAEASGSRLQIAEALHELGRAQAESGDDQAIETLERARSIYVELGLPARQAEALHSLAGAEDARGLPERAVAHGEAALDRLDQVRLRLAAPEMRAYFSALRRDYYQSQIERLMDVARRANDAGDRARAALETSERARARMISDLLQEASIDARSRIGTEATRRRTALYEQLAELGSERERLLEAAPERDAARLERVVAEIAATENELNLLEVRVRRDHPELASLSPPEPLDARGMQALLDDDSVLLQYAFAERTSYVWVVSRDAVRAVELGPRDAVEAAAHRVLEGFKTYTPSASARARREQDMRALADLVLAPALEHVDARRIVLSLDGPLHYVPFAALPLPTDGGAERRLLDTHRIVRVPSMSALAAMRRRGELDSGGKTLAVFADPVLGAADSRLGTDARLVAAAPAASRDGLLTRAYAGSQFQRLQSTAYEADAIASLVPEEQRFVVRGFDASREAALETDLRPYRYVHFATHGFVNARHPALSGLALSRFDANGAPRNGFLRLHDIYDMRLDAELVVLSACETALGRELRGEGLVGLSQGFMYAGARSVVASLWQVPDRATSELMMRFYRFLIADGLRPAEALRRAQLELAGERRWGNPYFWGGFVLLGDW